MAVLRERRRHLRRGGLLEAPRDADESRQSEAASSALPDIYWKTCAMGPPKHVAYLGYGRRFEVRRKPSRGKARVEHGLRAEQHTSR